MVTVKYTPNWSLLSKSESSTLSASRKRGAQVAQNGPGKSCKSCDNAFGTFDPISSPNDAMIGKKGVHQHQYNSFVEFRAKV